MLKWGLIINKEFLFHYNYVIKLEDGLLRNDRSNKLIELCIYKRRYIWIYLFTNSRKTLNFSLVVFKALQLQRIFLLIPSLPEFIRGYHMFSLSQVTLCLCVYFSLQFIHSPETRLHNYILFPHVISF